MEKLRWLREEVVFAIHQRQLAEHGGAPGLRDRTLLEAALARPRNQAGYRLEADLADLAAVGIDLDDVVQVLEDEGVEKFEKSWQELVDTIQGQLDKARS